jgi:hypothetical protein
MIEPGPLGAFSGFQVNLLLEPGRATGKEKRLLDQLRNVMGVRHYSLRTERPYC